MAEGERGAVWQYEDKLVHTAGLSVAAGKAKEEFSPNAVSFDNMRPGAYDAAERVKDMDRAGILAAGGFFVLAAVRRRNRTTGSMGRGSVDSTSCCEPHP